MDEITVDGALFWSEEEGYILSLPETANRESLPAPLYVLGLCYWRLSHDPDFSKELIAWSKFN